MNFTVYSKQGCPYCVQIQRLLQEVELKHVIYELDRDFDKDSFYSQFGEGSTFPQVVVDGKDIGGAQDAVKYIKENILSV